MSFFDDASLVMIPSGYKTSKVYSVKPTDGTGDLAFTRSNDTATRVASSGLIEKVRTNLVLQSQAFNTTANWPANASPTITANTTVAPDGTTTADTIAATASFSGIYQSPVNVSNGVEHSWSVYIKNISSASNIFLGIGANPSNATINYNATSGTITSSGAGLTASSATNVGDGWYRLSGTYVTTGTTNDFVIYGMGTMSFAVWGAQLETGVTTAYIATTTAAVSVGPVANVPRLDYLNSSCPRLLLEPQRTNTALYSEQFTNAVWTGSGSTVVDNQAASPDGYTNADLLYPAASGNFTGKYQNLAAGTTGVVSCYVKQAGKRFAQLGTDNNATYTCGFDLQLGTVVRTATNQTATITSVGNGWYRITAAYVSSAGASYPFVGVSDNAAGAVTADGTNGLYVYGFQYETSASYATSYIPTLGASVTRGADAASKASISSLIGQTEGTLFVDLSDVNDLDFPEITIDNNNNTDRIVLTRSAAGNWGFFVASSAASTFSAYSTVSSTSGKFALAYSSAGYALYRNGVQIVTGTYNLPTALSAIRFNGRSSSEFFASKCVKQAIIFPTRLSAADLAALTA